MAEILTPDDERRIIEAVLLLGMTPPFTVEAARDQYRRLARIYHPDAGRTADAERFKALGEAVRTVEAHAAAFASGGLAWNAGGASGGARASQAAQLLEKLSAAEMTIVQKDSELHRLRLERDFAARQTAEKKRRGPSAGVIFTGYVLLLGVVAIMGVLLAAKSQPREATLEAFEVMLDPVTVEGYDAKQGKYAVRLEGARVRVGPVNISSAEHRAVPMTTDSSGTLSGEVLRVKIGTPNADFPVEPAILVDAYRYHDPAAQRRVYAVLRGVNVRTPERLTELEQISVTTSPIVSHEHALPDQAATIMSGYAQTKNHVASLPSGWPHSVTPNPEDPVEESLPSALANYHVVGVTPPPTLLPVWSTTQPRPLP